MGKESVVLTDAVTATLLCQCDCPGYSAQRCLAVCHSNWSLTPSLPRCHLKTTSKSAKFETCKPFYLLFCTGVWKDFSSKCLALKVDVLWDWKVYCLQVCAYISRPGNFTCWCSDGVNNGRGGGRQLCAPQLLAEGWASVELTFADGCALYLTATRLIKGCCHCHYCTGIGSGFVYTRSPDWTSSART